MQKRKRLTIAERQKRLNRICMVAEYIAPIIVSAVTATALSIMVTR